ncbi:PAS domain-containing protein [Nostoc spongiaeforme FACHB-130]|uniref:histidine kinase n=1 Tax=Nostoc spongiaeforme FACHB-130 TaxID=1357510 RepID=A0ABR8G0N9_9NOSO|nr:PAS domain-containing protein [Nostoc spongiaeforme]MBD2596781.1 PAS domain-containing protein [Nostoc spongiaeforme FACHB-130]
MNIFIQIPLIPCNHSDAGQSMLLWLHIVSDSLIAIAYYSIPCTLLYFVRKRPDLPFNWIFLLFALLMLSCGTSHWIEIWTLWHPIYWLSGGMKAIAALVSLYTALELIRLMPQALTFPSPAQLEATNKELAREISERQKIEAALRCSEERWHLAVAGTSEAIWDWDIPTNQTYRSERWYEMLGYQHHELSNEDDEWSKRIHPNDYEQVIAAQTAYLLQQAPEYNVEYRLRRKDGSYGWFRSRAKAVWDEQGNPVRLVGSLGEITDRKQVELVLQEREAMLRRIGDNLPNGAIYKVIRELDGSDRFYYLSAGIENIMEVSAADALKDASLLYRQFIPEDIPRLYNAENESKQHLSIFDIQLRICTPSGKLKWCHFRSSPRRLEDGRIAWDGMVVDITEFKRTEEILRKNEALLEEAQRVARLGNWDYDLATGKISWSKGLFELFRRDSKLSPPSYEENLQLYHPEDREKLDQAVVRAISTGESYKLVMRATRTDNVEIYVEGIGYAEFNNYGEVVRLYGTAQDITERKQAEAALQASERRFRGIFNNSFQFIGLLSVDGTLLEANQTALDFAGIKPEDVINRPFWDTHWWTISPETQEQLKQAIASAAQGNFVRYEVDVLGANNQVATIDFSLRPLQDETGEVILLIPEGRDITERQAALRDRIQAEEKLRRSELQLNAAQHIAHVGSWEWNLGDEQQIWSTETFLIFGLYPIQPAPTQAEFLQMVHPDDRPVLQAHFLAAIVDSAPINVEYRIIRPDGSMRYLESKAEVAYDTKHQQVKLFGAILDITERKQAELEIIKSRDLLEAIYNESADALFLVDPETLLTIDCNHRAVELFAARCKADLIGIKGQTLHKRPLSSQEVAEILVKINQQGCWSQEIEYVTKQGNCFWGNIAVKQIRVAEQVMNLVRVTDISDRKLAEAALTISEEQQRLTLEYTRIGTWDWNLQTNEVIWNDNHCRLLGLDPETSTAQYQLWRDAVHPEDIEKVELSISQALADHTNFEAEYRVIFPNGEIRWLTGKGHGIYNTEGQPIRMLGVIIDISDRKLAEEKLKQAELQYRTLVEQIPGVVYTSPIAGSSEFAYISPQIQTLLNVPAQEWEAGLCNSWVNFVNPQDHPFVLQAVQTTLATGEPLNIEYRMMTQDNKVIWVQDQARLVLAPDGKTPILQGVAFNISDRKQAEQALQEKENFLRSIYDGVAQAIFVVDVVDNDFRYVGLNNAHEELTGLISDDVQGKTPEQLLPPTAAMKVRQHYQNCLNAGTTITYEECLPFKGQETWWFTSLTPLRDNNHRVYRIVGSCINITEQKRAQQMLELQAVITRNMAEGICLVRASDGIIVYANPKFEKMFGYDTDELTGLHISIINYAKDQAEAEAVNQAISTTVLQHGEASYEVHNVKKDGTPFWCSATTSMFEHPEYGQVFVAVHQDITEQKQVQEQLKASLKEKEVLLKEIHHRVKNNLGIVSSLLQMQCRRTQDTEATAILRDSQNRIASIALVHEKLYRSADLANIDFAQYIPDLTTHLFDSYNVTPNCIKLKIQVNNASLDIETAIPCGLIINELVSNALKYAFPHQSTGEIIVSLEQQDNSNLILIIQDNGVGLPQDFNPQHTKTLGIILVQGLVKQLRGTMEFNSQQGTEFKITFTKSRA